MANEYENAARKLREANDELDSVRRAKRPPRSRRLPT